MRKLMALWLQCQIKFFLSPPLLQWFFILLFCLGLFFWGYSSFLSQKIKHLYLQYQQETQLKAQLNFAYQKIAQLPAYQRQVTTMQAKLKTALAKPAEISIFLETLSQLAMQQGLQFKLIKPGNVQQFSNYVEIPIQLMMVGEYLPLARFLNQLGQLKNVISFDQLQINTMERDASGHLPLTMHVTLKTYWQSPMNGPLSRERNNNSELISLKPPPIFSSSRNPFQPLDKTLSPTLKMASGLERPREKLEIFNLDTLCVVGSVQTFKTAWAAILAPDTHVYWLGLGEHIGQHQGQLIHITHDAVELTEMWLTSTAWRQQHVVLAVGNCPTLKSS